jgi:hypothetical protein
VAITNLFCRKISNCVAETKKDVNLRRKSSETAISEMVVSEAKILEK